MKNKVKKESFLLNIPTVLKEEIKVSADKNYRSITAEILFVLESHLNGTDNRQLLNYVSTSK